MPGSFDDYKRLLPKRIFRTFFQLIFKFILKFAEKIIAGNVFYFINTYGKIGNPTFAGFIWIDAPYHYHWRGKIMNSFVKCFQNRNRRFTHYGRIFRENSSCNNIKFFLFYCSAAYLVYQAFPPCYISESVESNAINAISTVLTLQS